nr:C-type lectin 37Db-like [Drosophila takahashii]
MADLRHHLKIQADGLQAILSRNQIQESAIDKLQADLNSKDVRLQRMEESLQKLIRQDSEEKQIALESKIQISLEEQLAEILHALRLSMNFKKIQSRYFYFNHDIEKSWRDAEYFCVEKGGHLATFKNNEELMAISAKVDPDVRYWLGANDRARKGNFVYLDTGRKVSYLKWSPGEPDYWNNDMHCVVFYKGAMRVHECHNKNPVICQIGNEI